LSKDAPAFLPARFFANDGDATAAMIREAVFP
jgi:hypothetical protein